MSEAVGGLASDAASELTTVARVATDLVSAGAQAVVLGGSVARGDAHRFSDIDVVAIGAAGGGPEYSLRVVDGRLVSVSWRTGDDVRALLDSPADAGGAVPAWRAARIVHDEKGWAAALQEFARGWSWTRIDAACDEYVADATIGLAEEVLRLAGMLEVGNLAAAAAMRNVLALRLPMVMAVHHRILYDSENALWAAVDAAMGPAWAAEVVAASGVATVDLATGSAAAGAMYLAVAAAVGSLIDGEDRAVVDLASEVAAGLRARGRRRD